MRQQEQALQSRIEALQHELADKGAMVESERNRAVHAEAELEVLQGKLGAQASGKQQAASSKLAAAAAV